MPDMPIVVRYCSNSSQHRHWKKNTNRRTLASQKQHGPRLQGPDSGRRADDQSFITTRFLWGSISKAAARAVIYDTEQAIGSNPNVHFARLANTLLKDEESARDNHVRSCL